MSIKARVLVDLLLLFHIAAVMTAPNLTLEFLNGRLVPSGLDFGQMTLLAVWLALVEAPFFRRMTGVAFVLGVKIIAEAMSLQLVIASDRDSFIGFQPSLVDGAISFASAAFSITLIALGLAGVGSFTRWRITWPESGQPSSRISQFRLRDVLIFTGLVAILVAAARATFTGEVTVPALNISGLLNTLFLSAAGSVVVAVITLPLLWAVFASSSRIVDVLLLLLGVVIYPATASVAMPLFTWNFDIPWQIVSMNYVACLVYCLTVAGSLVSLHSSAFASSRPLEALATATSAEPA